MFSGMGREVEHLIHENTQLLETKLVLIIKQNVFVNVNTNKEMIVIWKKLTGNFSKHLKLQ